MMTRTRDTAIRTAPPAERRDVARSRPLVGTAIAVVASAALCLTGCTSGAGPAKTTARQSASASAPAQSGRISLEDAASKARALTPNSTVISIETESAGQHWEIKTATNDGAEFVTVIAMSDGSVVRGPDKKNEDADDTAETRTLLTGAKLGYREAAKLIGKQVSAGTLTELNLDDFNGATVWEGDVMDGSGTKHEIKIDATSGSVLANNTDTPDD